MSWAVEAELPDKLISSASGVRNRSYLSLRLTEIKMINDAGTQGRRDAGTQGRSNIEPLFRSNLGLKSGTSELHENWSGRMEYFRLK